MLFAGKAHECDLDGLRIHRCYPCQLAYLSFSLNFPFQTLNLAFGFYSGFPAPFRPGSSPFPAAFRGNFVPNPLIHLGLAL